MRVSRIGFTPRVPTVRRMLHTPNKDGDAGHGAADEGEACPIWNPSKIARHSLLTM